MVWRGAVGEAFMITYTELVDEILRSTARRRRNRNKQGGGQSGDRKQSSQQGEGEQRRRRSRGRRGNRSHDKPAAKSS